MTSWTNSLTLPPQFRFCPVRALAKPMLASSSTSPAPYGSNYRWPWDRWAERPSKDFRVPPK